MAGILAGAVLAAAQIDANGDLGRGATLLALSRLVAMAELGVALGVSASVALSLILGVLGDGIRLRRGILALVAVGLGVAFVAAALPASRSWLLSLAGGETSITGLVAGVTVGAAAAALFGLRARDAMRGREFASRGRESASGWESRLRGTGALLGLAMLAAVGVGHLLFPRIAESRAQGHPSVILISIDTLRADRLGVLGNPRPLTPGLDRRANEGTFFANATSPAPWTKPAHASLFLSLLPFDHQARWNRTPIRAHRSMLAERFRDAGYRTAAFTGGASVHGDAGFDQGFEIYENHNELEAGGAESHLGRASEWACGRGSARFFLFLHTYEAHIPYTHRDFADPADAGRLGGEFDFDDLERIREGELELTSSERRFVADLYDGDVAHADELIGNFLEVLDRCGVLAGSIVVVFSDHGEDLWDHEPIRSPDHGHSLYEELVRVPLIIWQPGVVKADRRVQTPVSLLDVAPTLLALSGLPPDPQHRGINLAPALLAGSEPPAHPVYSESVEYGPDRFAIRAGDLKVVVTPFPEHSPHAALEVAPLEVFDLAADPREGRNLASRRDPAARDLVRSVARRAVEKLNRPETPSQADEWLSADRREQLRALGYAE